ncbi:hypothetical protein UG55_106552 [Frankia sp. EI5c]|uniref:hypothetical protein n=1 Tax=Frankia sp. EI5c TaxID=683316 RepID=UPI0007C29571|nr:hypothetical protein [Frankia sp. EI5c]OAA21112.1 hypothetical protein UG55_106552 [Frankia sp. EI5c]
MRATTWMWEARAAPGRVGDLERWAHEATRGREAEIYLGRGAAADLVVILLHVGAGGAAGAEAAGPPLPDPPDGLVTGLARAWEFGRARSPS